MQRLSHSPIQLVSVHRVLRPKLEVHLERQPGLFGQALAPRSNQQARSSLRHSLKIPDLQCDEYLSHPLVPRASILQSQGAVQADALEHEEQSALVEH